MTRTGIGLSLLAFCTLAHAGSLSCLTGGVSYVPAQPWPFDSIVVSAWAVRPCTGGKAPLCYDALPARIGATVQVAAGTIEVDVYGSDGALPAGVPLLATPAAGAYDEFLELPVAAIAPGKYGFRHRVHNVDALGATTTCELFNVYPRTVNVRGVDGPVERRTAVEYYHAALDHYFVTAEPAEIADLDAGVHAGWARTGGTFAVFSPGKSGGTGVPVCRFYGLPGAGLDSHFYTANAAECAEIPVKYKGTWQLESANAFEVWLPEDVAPYCDLGTRSIARLWNQRTDSNHRFTTDGNVLSAMSQRGYVMEGVGWPSPVSMCSP